MKKFNLYKQPNKTNTMLEERKIGVFFGRYKDPPQKDVNDLESRIVEITPEIEEKYKKEIEIYKKAVKQNPYIRVELVWDK